MAAGLHPELRQLVGSWRLISFGSTFVDTRERVEPFGPQPDGRMVLEPGGRVMFLFTKADRQPAVDVAGRSALFMTMMAYTGHVRWDGPGRLVTDVDIAWLPEWRGEQQRFFELYGDRLSITSSPYAPPRAPGRLAVADVVFVREVVGNTEAEAWA